MNMHWDDYRAVLTVVRRRTLSAAAEDLGVNYTTVARRISRAESATGEVLFERLADGYRPTEAGKLVARHAAEMESAEHAMLRGLSGRDEKLEGELTLTAPQLLIAQVLAPVLDAFSKQHPDVTLRVRAANEILDLNKREADIAIRISRNPGDTLKGLRLAEQHAASFAAPELAERIANDPEGVVDWLVYERRQDLPEHVRASRPGSRIKMRFDDMVAMSAAAQAGLGVVRMPVFLGRSLQGLVQVPEFKTHPYADIWIVAHPDVWPSAKLEAFRAIVVPYFRENRPLFEA
ncbi:LysR family transcriptional regulator [Ruegeria sp. Ofav3-42]|uniref:LysR family transcriptional regulator n=1 Tax=Ruegeria sp. Ofav3-42 TaxID=2917759 RepID=UPI001EF693EA|nr:LysR family transcriptional regulator [Ruegeria sp. Ofav3-42]MCG7519449.1 LysR family transcriptional regulator [Ruegeria sp. Ofav3-42]